MQITLTIDYAGASADAIETFARALARLMMPAAPAAPRARAASPMPAPQPAAVVFPASNEAPASEPAEADAETDDGWPGPDVPATADQPKGRKRGRPSKAEMEARAAAAPTAPAPAAPAVDLVAPVAKAAGSAPAAQPAPGEVTEDALRAVLAKYFQEVGPTKWVEFCKNNGGYRTLAGVLATADGETAADVQARMQKFHKFLTDGLAQHAASKG